MTPGAVGDFLLDLELDLQMATLRIKVKKSSQECASKATGLTCLTCLTRNRTPKAVPGIEVSRIDPSTPSDLLPDSTAGRKTARCSTPWGSGLREVPDRNRRLHRENRWNKNPFTSSKSMCKQQKYTKIWNSSKNTWISSHIYSMHHMSMLTQSGCGSIFPFSPESCLTTLRYPGKNSFLARYETYPHFCNKNTLSNYLSTRFWILFSILKIFGSAKHTAQGASKVMMRKKTAAGHAWELRHKWWIHRDTPPVKYQNMGIPQFWDNPIWASNRTANEWWVLNHPVEQYPELIEDWFCWPLLH